MQKAIAKYGLAAHLALLAVAPLFLFQSCGAPAIASVLLWLSLIGSWWILLEPSLRGGEMLHDARRRVWRAIWRDPLFWTLLFVVVLTGIRALNTGIAMSYDFESRSWSVSSPNFPILPGSHAESGVLPFAAAVALGVVVTGCRHALGRSARMAFLLVASALSGLAASILVLQASHGDKVANWAMECGPCWLYHPGVAFAIFLLCGTVALYGAFERGWNAAVLLVVFAVGGNAAGLFVFAPALDVVVFAAAEVVLFVVVFVVACRTLRGSGEFRMLVVFSIALVLGTLFVVSVLPEDVVAAKTAPIVAMDFLPADMLARRGVLSDAAFKSWVSHPWVGVGMGAFQFSLRFSVSASDWALVPQGIAAVPNGWRQLLVERGIVGSVAMALPFGFLLFTYFRRAVSCVRARRLPGPTVVVAPLAVLPLVATARFDCSLLRPDVLVITGAILAVSAKSFPKEMIRGNG